MDDLISRQAAIDAIEFGITYAKAINKETGEVKELFQASNDELRKAEDRIKQLPSAQPEIIYCGECKHMMPNGKTMDDLISRQAAIDELDKGAWGVDWDETLAKTMIESLPSAQPEVKEKGEAMNDLISRQEAIKLLEEWAGGYSYLEVPVDSIADKLNELPAVEPTLYGYKIEHLAYIATVMKKEGVTAEYAVRTFDDIGRAVKMVLKEVHVILVEEIHKLYKVEEEDKQ